MLRRILDSSFVLLLLHVAKYRCMDHVVYIDT